MYVKRLLAAELAHCQELDQLSTLSGYLQSDGTASAYYRYHAETAPLTAPWWTAPASTRRESASCRLNSDVQASIGKKSAHHAKE